MKKHLVLLILTLIFLSCSDKKEEDNKTVSNSTKNSSSMLKIANESSSDISIIYTNYEEALSTAKKENKALFILFSTKYCRWCFKLKETTLKDPKIVQQLNEEFIVLFLDRDKDKYPHKYKVKAVPAVYLADKNEEVFTTIVGYHKNPKDYLKWFKYIKIELEIAEEED